MIPNQCKPDSVTYGTLISAFDKGGQWTQALQVHSCQNFQLDRETAGASWYRGATKAANLEVSQSAMQCSRLAWKLFWSAL